MIKINNNYRIEGDVCYLECHSKGNIVEVSISIEDLERVKEYPLKWCVKDSGNGRFYCFGVLEGKPYYLHRWILNPPDNKVVDHINNNGLDNRRSNIRVVTRSVNSINNSCKGVEFRGHTDRWRARVYIKGREYYLGDFDNKEEALKIREAFLDSKGLLKKSEGIHNVQYA